MDLALLHDFQQRRLHLRRARLISSASRKLATTLVEFGVEFLLLAGRCASR